MLKKELAELIASAKDDDNIDEIISKSDLGKALLSSGLTLDAFKEKIANDPVFKSYMDSEKDIHSTKALDTWKTNNLQKLVNEEYKKQHPDADPKDTELIELKKTIEKMQKDTVKQNLTNNALKVATEKGLPIELIDFIVGEDEATTTANLDKLVKVFFEHDGKLKADILKDSTYVPPAGGASSSNANPWSKEHYNLTLQGKILTENPELAKKYMAEAKK